MADPWRSFSAPEDEERLQVVTGLLYAEMRKRIVAKCVWVTMRGDESWRKCTWNDRRGSVRNLEFLIQL